MTLRWEDEYEQLPDPREISWLFLDTTNLVKQITNPIRHFAETDVEVNRQVSNSRRRLVLEAEAMPGQHILRAPHHQRGAFSPSVHLR